MTMKTFATTATTAAATMALMLAAFWPAGLSAKGTGDPAALKAKIATPTLKAGGCHLTIRPTAGKYKPNDMPELELKIVNPTDAPVTFEVVAGMMSRSPAPPMARMLPMPRSLWHRPCPLSLGPRETKVLTLATKTKVAGGSTVFFTLKVGKASITGARVSVAPAKGKNALAAALSLSAAAKPAPKTVR